MLYSEKVMDHFRNPRNVGVIENADGVGEVGNTVCGDIMKIYLKIKDGIIEDVKFNTFGCGSAIASSSMATEMIKGKPVSEALELTNKAVAEALDGLPAHNCIVPFWRNRRSKRPSRIITTKTGLRTIPNFLRKKKYIATDGVESAAFSINQGFAHFSVERANAPCRQKCRGSL